MFSLINGGHLYIAQPPLYRIKKGKKEIYLKNDEEMDKFLLTSAIENIKLRVNGKKNSLSGESLINIVRRIISCQKILKKLENKGLDSRVIKAFAKDEVFQLDSMTDRERLKERILRASEYIRKYHGEIVTVIDIEEDQEHGCYKFTCTSMKDNQVRKTMIDTAFIISPSFEELRKHLKQLAVLGDPPYVLEKNSNTVSIASMDDLVSIIFDFGRSGLTVQRFKGLGEMNPNQLWETTMNPDKRTLLQVRVEDAVEADEVFSTLMGDHVEERRKFINDNALSAINLDI